MERETGEFEKEKLEEKGGREKYRRSSSRREVKDPPASIKQERPLSPTLLPKAAGVSSGTAAVCY